MVTIKFWKNWTIATKIGTVISTGVIAAILVIAIGTGSFLKKEYLRIYGKQLATTVQAFAMYLDDDLATKLKALTVVARIVPPEALIDSPSAQRFLATRTGLPTLFDDGVMILSAEGKLLAEIPFISQERIGTDYSLSPYFQQASKEQRPLISAPFYSIKAGQRPIIQFMAPIHDANKQKIIAYLCGGLTLTGDNVLGNIARRKVGDSGYFYIYTQDRTILIHQDSSRMMKRDVPVGANRLFDLALQGFDGSGESVTSKGLHAMASFQHLKVAPWILAANSPMKEVLAPFYVIQWLIILTISICGTGILLFSWWSLFRFMAPLHRFINHMKEYEGEHFPCERDGGPEVTLIATMFNQMIARLKKDEAQIRKLSLAVEQSPISIVITDTHGTIEFVNPQFTKLTGYTPEEALGENPRFLKSEKTPPEVYSQLWQTISSGKTWEGELYNKRKNGEQFIEHAIISPILNKNGDITHYMAIKEDISAQKLSEETIWRQANFDSLTQLPNRSFLLACLQDAIHHTKREHSSLALLFLDLDHFKEVNDTLGHDYGDILLIEAARRIVICVRDTDTVARFGGDEFVLLLTNINSEKGLGKVTAKIITTLNEPFYLKNEVAHVSASIGVTTCPEDGTDINILLKNADLAMYLAKDAGRNCWRSFTDVLKPS